MTEVLASPTIAANTSATGNEPLKIVESAASASLRSAKSGPSTSSLLSSSASPANNNNSSSIANHNQQQQITALYGGHHHDHHQMAAAADNESPQRHAGSSPSNSPRHVRSSPRCEAFVMTGDKMLNLNPKISPYYAKMYQNQLPPTVEVDSEEEQQRKKLLQQQQDQQLSTTPKSSKMDEFYYQPGLTRRQQDEAQMQHQQMREVATTSSSTTDINNVIGQIDYNIDQQDRLYDQAGGERDDDSGPNNIVPADPGNRQQQQQHFLHSSSVTALPPEHHNHNHPSPSSSQSAAANAAEAVTATTGAQQTTQLLNEKAITNVARFMAAQQHSKSTPASPARQKQQQQVEQMGVNHIRDVGMQQRWQPYNFVAMRQKESGIALLDSQQISNRSSEVFQSNYTPETIARLAKHLFTHQEGIKIAAFLVKSDDLSMRIAHEFVAMFNFAGIRVDVALRTFLSHVCLTGETGDRAQLLSHFAQRYYECNPIVFHSADEIHALTCALLLLNTDLHGRTVKKMSCREFIENLAHTDFKFDHGMLRELFSAIKERPFHYKPGEEPIQPSAAIGNCREKRLSHLLSQKSRSSSAGMVAPEQQVDYKHGWLLKKSMYDADGKRTPFGRRKWQMLYATIRGMVFYLHQNENSFASGRYIAFRNCILLHHSLAEIPRDYTKRNNVFRLRTANLGEFMFQTSDPAEVQKWVDAVNYVAAAFSTPALPTPVSSNGMVAFYKPHLPSLPTHFSIPDQLRAHEQRLDETSANLARLRENAPSMKAKGKLVYDYFYKERYLDKERERYTIYVNILRDKLAAARPTTSASSSAAALRCVDSSHHSSSTLPFGGSAAGNRTTTLLRTTTTSNTMMANGRTDEIYSADDGDYRDMVEEGEQASTTTLSMGTTVLMPSAEHGSQRQRHQRQPPPQFKSYTNL